MRERPRKVEPPQFLNGWKEIANYLGKGVRTVQRYESQLGLPVRRPAGKPWGSVVATKGELDAWMSALPIRDAFKLPQREVGNEYADRADQIKRSLQKMVELRDQMLGLRAEVRSSVEMLRVTVHELQGGLNPTRYRDSSATSPSNEKPEAEGEAFELDEFDFLTLPTDYPKV